MYLYETHLHTSPMSACAKATVRENLEYYKSAGYAGVFLTDHFIDGNINHSLRNLSYEERIEAYFNVYEEAKPIGDELGIDVFSAIEMSHLGTDFLVYGIDKEWCLAHKDMDKLKKSELLRLLMNEGALVVQAHPFRAGAHIDHVRLYPGCIHGVEVYNAGRNDFENELAEQYAKNYNLLRFAGTDNHIGPKNAKFAGVATERPIKDVKDFINLVFAGDMRLFKREAEEIEFI